MFGKIVLALSALALASAQIPSLGWCPEYVPMANFDMNRFLGIWYEAERYFQLSEVVSRCVMANYTKINEKKYRVSNEVTNRFTGIKRILEGELRKAETKADEGKLLVKYTTIPLVPETKYSVLETDYDSYAVLWSCSGIGPVHTQNAWLMTRERIPSTEVLQKAYGVLDKYKISRTFFVKTDQADCAHLDAKPTSEKPVGDAGQAAESGTAQAAAQPGENLRSAITPDAPDVILQSKKTKEAVVDSKPSEDQVPDLPIEAPVEEPAKELPKLSDKSHENRAENSIEKESETSADVPAETTQTLETIPERILKVAETIKEGKPVETPEESKAQV